MRSGVYFDDVDVGTAYGFAVADVEGWGGAADEGRPLVVVPRRPGALAVGPAQVAVRSLTLSGHITGANIAEARRRVDAVRVACAAQNSVRLRTEDEPDVELVCVFARLTAPPTAARFASRQIPVALDLVALEPFKIARVAEAIALASGGPAVAMPLGSAPVAPVVTITGAAAPVLTYRDASGATLAVVELSDAGGAVGTVVVDGATGRIHNDAGASRLAHLTNASAFPFVLDPAHATGYGTPGVVWPTLAVTGGAAVVAYRRRFR